MNPARPAAATRTRTHLAQVLRADDSLVVNCEFAVNEFAPTIPFLVVEQLIGIRRVGCQHWSPGCVSRTNDLESFQHLLGWRVGLHFDLCD